ncbi:TolC family protein [Acetobacteraceae bacterium]|nr:TolC family protein [Acetobacteraceae bacterium]
MKRFRLILAGFLGLFFAGCNFAPITKRPHINTPRTYPDDAGGKTDDKLASENILDLGWEDFFTDPRLKMLIQNALEYNRDLAGQFEEILQARGQYMAQRGMLLPQIGITENAEFMDPSDAAGYSFAPGSGRANPFFQYYSEGIGFASYEIDFWGRIANLSKAQKELALQNSENLRSLWLTILSEVAGTYIRWLEDRDLLILACETYLSQKHTLDLIQMTFNMGQADGLTVADAKTQVEQSATQVEQASRLMAQDEHMLTELVGGKMPEFLPPPKPLGEQTVLRDLPAGLPSQLLNQRPDIRSAEHKLRQTNAEIGSARAAFFPKFTLSATEGNNALQFNHLFSKFAETFTINPQMTIPVLTWGVNTGNLKSAESQAKQAAAFYQKTALEAIHEVSDALTARDTYAKQEKHTQLLVDSTGRSYSLAWMKYQEGIENYQIVLEQQRSFYSAQQNLIQVEAARFQNLVTVYRVLGGGWRKNGTLDAPVEKKDATRAEFPRQKRPTWLRGWWEGNGYGKGF